MVLLTCDETKFLSDTCEKLLEEFDVRFVCVINHLGNLVAGNNRMGIKPYAQDAKRKIMFTQMMLSSSMDRELDESLGSVEYNASFRKNVIIISIPRKGGDLIVISAEKTVDVKQLVKKTKKLFEIGINKNRIIFNR